MNWSDKMISYFASPGAMYYVQDELGVLKQPEMMQTCKEHNMIVIDYEDVVAFRLFYETNYRHVDKTYRPTSIINIMGDQFNTLPYDVLAAGVRIDLSSNRFFSNLDPAIIKHYPSELLPKLFELHQQLFQKLNRKATFDYLLENVFELSLQSIVNSVSLLKVAVDYYKKFDFNLPAVFYKRLNEMMVNNNFFDQEDVIKIFKCRGNFERFINKEWQLFVDSYHIENNEQIAEEAEKYGKQYFIDPYLQANVMNMIKPIEVENLADYEEWMHKGLIVKERAPLFYDDYSSFTREDWLQLACRIGEEQAKLLDEGIVPQHFTEHVSKANTAFQQWMETSYYSIRTLPAVPLPKMVHQIPHYLSRKADQKIALVVLDGMSFTQWHTIKKYLLDARFTLEEHAVFTWVPSVTSVARQSIFSGKEPRHFADTIDKTHKEKMYWQQFWEKEGFTKNYVAYEKSLGLEPYSSFNFIFQKMPNIRIYGAVIDVIDQIMHGAMQGLKTLQSEINNWLDSNYLVQFLSDLSVAGFEVYITSDHGNVEAIGRGRIPQGVTVDTKGERFRTYQSEYIRNQTALEHSDTVVWNDSALPDDYFVLLANDKRAFTQKNDKIVTHGGMHIEEVIVPFVKVTR